MNKNLGHKVHIIIPKEDIYKVFNWCTDTFGYSMRKTYGSDDVWDCIRINPTLPDVAIFDYYFTDLEHATLFMLTWL